MKPLSVIKIGGAELAEGPALNTLVEALSKLVTDGTVIVVHGGGAEIAELQRHLGIEPCFIEGLRVTDEASMRVAEMVLSGLVNKRLTARLVANGVEALGLSGVDAGLLRAQPLRHHAGNLGRVGEITQVNAAALQALLGAGYTPVISPISYGADGRALNVNADHAALAIAAALHAKELTFLTDVPGVLQEERLLTSLSASEAQRMIDASLITGGMIPKVRSALRAIDQGVLCARITNLDGLANGTGSCVTAFD